MAKITLPTNYRDDILNPSAEGKRKYVMSYNQDGTVSFEDVTPYEQVGSDYGAGDINTTNEAVNESFDKNKLIKDLDTINALTEEGYAPDALAFKELNNSLEKLTVWKFGVEEVIGKLENGEIIYRKRYSENFELKTGTIILDTISNINIIELNGNFTLHDGRVLPFDTFYNSDYNETLEYVPNNGNIQIRVLGDKISAYNVTVIYTK